MEGLGDCSNLLHDGYGNQNGGDGELKIRLFRNVNMFLKSIREEEARGLMKGGLG